MSGRALKDEARLLVLVRHGEAESEEVDPERPLTPQGREDVQRIAGWLHAAGVAPARILHSGKRRAEQTAEILQRPLRAAEGAAASDGLRPHDDIGFAVNLAEQARGVTLLVGHLPHLERLLDSLLSGRLNTRLAELDPAGVAILAARPDRWVLRVLVPAAAV